MSAAVSCKHPFAERWRAIAQICRGSFQDSGHGFLADAHERSRATQSLSRRNDSGGQAADSRDRVDGLFQIGGGGGGEGDARKLAPASISKGRKVQVYAPGEKLQRS